MDAFVQRRPKAASGNRSVDPSAKDGERPAKRTKRDEIPDSDSDDPDDEFPEVGGAISTSDDIIIEDHENRELPGKARPTDVENVLPATQDEEEAIIEYENFKLSQSSSQNRTSSKSAPLWTKGRSSIYVDAFILALDTVLDDESHLFDDKEMEIFRQWKELDYESQYL
jgi:Fanconi-associated nuclease 1